MAHSMRRRLVHAAILAVVAMMFTITVQQALAALTELQTNSTLAFLQEFAEDIDGLADKWTGTAFCEWEGISCDGAGNAYIDLSGKGLTGFMPTLPDGVDGSQVMVSSIDMSGNPDWNDKFQDSWGGLTNVRYLDLSRTALYGTIPDAWNGMTALEVVNIASTYTCKNMPNWNSTTIKVMDLSDNAFYGSLPESWGLMTSLTEVNISNTFLCGCVPDSWTSSAALVEAAATIGSGVSAANCEDINTCHDGNNDHCLYYREATSALTLNQRHTLAFLQEFPLDFPYLSTRWTGVDYCSWEGITCDAAGKVSLDLSGKNITGAMPYIDGDVSGWFVDVVSIDMSNNLFWEDQLQEHWAYLKNLKFLNLSYTALYDEIPDAYNGMRSLEEVYMTNTDICKGLPHWNIPSLRIADFSNSNMHGSLADSWAAMTNLTSVNLAGNDFCGCIPSTWTSEVLRSAATSGAAAADCATANACTVYSYVCALTPATTSTVLPVPTTTTEAPTTTTTASPAQKVSATLKFLQAFPMTINYLSTRWIGVSYCSWEGVSCDNASGTVAVALRSKNLAGELPPIDSGIDGAQIMVTSIDMSDNNRLTGFFQDSWAVLKNLKSLDLSTTSLRGDIPDSWNGMTALESVKISNTLACRNLPNWNIATLHTIDLSNNKMGGRLVNSWASMTSLTSVSIKGNGFCGCVPSTWTSSVLKNAVAAIGGNLVAANCGTSNQCGVGVNNCPITKNAAVAPAQLTVAVVAVLATAMAVLGL